MASASRSTADFFPQLEFSGRHIITQCIRPGQNEEIQVEEYVSQKFSDRLFRLSLSRRWLFREKVVWLVVVAPTEGKESDRINHAYIEFQKGYLCLLLAIIHAKRRVNLRLILLCMNKADLYLNKDPNIGGVGAMDAGLIRSFRERFKDHRSALREACQRRGIEFQEVMCSATEAWGFDYVSAKITQAVVRNSVLKHAEIPDDSGTPVSTL